MQVESWLYTIRIPILIPESQQILATQLCLGANWGASFSLSAAPPPSSLGLRPSAPPPPAFPDPPRARFFAELRVRSYAYEYERALDASFSLTSFRRTQNDTNYLRLRWARTGRSRRSPSPTAARAIPTTPTADCPSAVAGGAVTETERLELPPRASPSAARRPGTSRRARASAAVLA